MQRLPLLLVLLALVHTSHSQNLQFGLQGGLCLAGASAKEPGIPIKGGPGIGFAIGAMGDYALPDKRFSIRANLTFQYQVVNDNSNGFTGHIDVAALSLPIDFVYHTPLANGKLFFGAGPYVDCALFGHFSGDQGSDDSYPIEFGSSPIDDIKRMDYGIDLLAGYQLQKNMQLTAKFDYGIRDVSADPTFEKIHVRNFVVSFVYVLP